MTQNRRIVLNIVATYGRSVFALACGLFTGRWVLMSLGKVDYGLYGVVGGLAVFISFFNNVLATAVSRFYAYSIGKAKLMTDEREGVEYCRAWFNTALIIHTTVPVLLVAVGYPIGVWMIRNFLTIPPDKIVPCVWVFRFVCLSCFCGMVNVPFQALYTAKQLIAELTVYGFCQSLVNVCFLYFMVTHPGDWLVKYAAWACLVSIVPQLIICFRAFIVFPECRIRARYWMPSRRFVELGVFAFWQMFGLLGHTLRGQGIAIVVNKYFGPSVNAAMSIANQVNAQSTSLVAAMKGAFTPAITQMCGSSEYELMRKMAFRSCKFGLLLALLFLIPLAVELEEVLLLWLRTPPPYTCGLCWCMMIAMTIDKSSIGQMIVINATGKIAGYQFVSGILMIMSLPLAWLFAVLDMGVYAMGGAIVFAMLGCSIGRIVFARTQAKMRVRDWFGKIIMPIILVAMLSGAIGVLPQLFLEPSFIRVIISTCCSAPVFCLLSWFFVIDSEERETVLKFIKGKFRK